MTGGPREVAVRLQNHFCRKFSIAGGRPSIVACKGVYS